MLERCITCWFGSAEAFEEMMRLHVLPSLKRQLGPLALPYSWMVGASTPVLWMSLPSLLPFNTNLPAESFPNHYPRTTCFLIAWWLAGLDLARATGRLREDYGKTTGRRREGPQGSRCVSRGRENASELGTGRIREAPRAPDAFSRAEETHLGLGTGYARVADAGSPYVLL